METKEAVAVVESPSFSTQMDFSFRKVEGAKHLAFNTIRKDIDRLSSNMADEIVPLREVKFVLGTEPTGLGVVLKGNTFGFTPWALSQMSSRLQKGLSASLVSELSAHDSGPKKHKVLKQLLTILRDEQPDQELLYRTMDVPKMHGQAGVHGPIVRGVLTTSRYSTADNGQLIDRIEKAIPEGWGTSEFGVNFEGMTVRFVDKTQPVYASRFGGDRQGLFSGLQLQTSEVGRRSLLMNAFFWRLVCSNGMMLPSAIYAYRRKHTGDVLENFDEAVSDLMQKLPGLTERMRSAIERAQAKVLTPKRSLVMLNAAIEDPDGAKALVKKFGDRDQTLVMLQNQVKHEADGMKGKMTRWGVVNALTRSAQSLPIDKRLKVEAYSADLLLNE